MPRKLSDHFHILSLFLFNKLSKKWKIESLNNLDEKKLFLKLCKSKIFLSFSYTEGFGMPPLEAAIAGNKVIGYTGGGGKEY
jgi:glycosyltransferase involved in cell wall biosynthesis